MKGTITTSWHRPRRSKRNLLWSVVLLLSLASPPFAPVLAIAWLIIGFLFGRSTSYDDWLQQV